eukprot:3464948-Karenia_brevis.AAC.1
MQAPRPPGIWIRKGDSIPSNAADLLEALHGDHVYTDSAYAEQSDDQLPATISACEKDDHGGDFAFQEWSVAKGPKPDQLQRRRHKDSRRL